MQHHSSPRLCEELKLKETCVPRQTQQMSHKFLHEEISKCTGKVHLEHLEATVLLLYLNKGVWIAVKFAWVWSSMFAIETAVQEDHLQYRFYLMIFNPYTVCLEMKFWVPFT